MIVLIVNKDGNMAAHGFPHSSPGRTITSKQALKHIAEGRSHFDQLEDHWDELIKDHEGEWVAAYKDEFVFGDSVPSVLAAAKSKGWPFDVIAIDHLTRKRATVLL